jgi:hypothetical protein
MAAGEYDGFREGLNPSCEPRRTSRLQRAYALVSKRTGRVIILAWPGIGIIPIWRHLRPLIEGIANESHQRSQTDGCKKPVGHVQALHESHQLAALSFYTKASSRDTALTT